MIKDIDFANAQQDLIATFRNLDRRHEGILEENEQLRLLLGRALVQLSKVSDEKFALGGLELTEDLDLAIKLATRWAGCNPKEKAALKFNLGVELSDREKELLDIVKKVCGEN